MKTNRRRFLAQSDPPVWDFHASESPSGRQMLFCRAKIGDAPGLYVMGADSSCPRLLTRGLDGQGADHPRWLPTVDSAERKG